jgi:hypothetical protein
VVEIGAAGPVVSMVLTERVEKKVESLEIINQAELSQGNAVSGQLNFAGKDAQTDFSSLRPAWRYLCGPTLW